MSGGMITADVSGKADTVLTSKGDLATWDTKRVRKGVSATNYTGLQADSAIADGLTYGATSRSTLTGTGSILYSSSANTLAQLSAGTGEYTLKMNSGGTAPEWVDVSAGGATASTLNAYLSSDFSTTETTATILTGITFDLPTISGGKCFIGFSCTAERSSNGGIQNYIATDTSGSDVAIAGSGRGAEVNSYALEPKYNLASQAIHDADGSTISIFCWTGGGTLTYKGSSTYEKGTSMSAVCVG